jgi:hypothetical protein
MWTPYGDAPTSKTHKKQHPVLKKNSRISHIDKQISTLRTDPLTHQDLSRPPKWPLDRESVVTEITLLNTSFFSLTAN